MMAKRSSTGKIVRKRLSDITNTQIPLISTKDKQTENLMVTEDYVNSLLKENVTLMNLVAERNKIIEATGVELQKLRINCQKLQLQNWNLAQSNSQMLAELNLGRERMKALQHELVCKNAILKAKHQELEESTKLNSENMELQGANQAVKAENKSKTNDKPSCNSRGTLRSRSMEPTSTNEQAINKEKPENKRRCLRQSARFRSQERESDDNLFELEEVKLSVERTKRNLLQKGQPIKTEVEKENCTPNSGTQESQRASLGRPLRRAAEKVQSYKEIPLNTKMRRPKPNQTKLSLIPLTWGRKCGDQNKQKN